MSGATARRPESATPRLEECSVAVLMGGRSSEREVSLATGREVLRALDQARTERKLRSARGVEILADGRWRLEGGRVSLSAAAALEDLSEIDLFFNGLHGGEGEDGTLQGLLALAGRRFTGSGVGASALCMDKQATRMLAVGEGLSVAPGAVVTRLDWDVGRAAALHRLGGLGSQGWFVKPRSGGSSVNTSLARRLSELPPAIEAILELRDDALVEVLVEGVELSCGVLGNRGDEGRPLLPIEIQPAAGRFFDYQQKYSPDGAREVCPPEGVGRETVARVQQAALRMHRAAGCDGYSRSDFIARRSGEIVLLEVNTLPGLTSRSLLPQEAQAAGIDYASLCLLILEHGLRASAWRRS